MKSDQRSNFPTTCAHRSDAIIGRKVGVSNYFNCPRRPVKAWRRSACHWGIWLYCRYLLESELYNKSKIIVYHFKKRWRANMCVNKVNSIYLTGKEKQVRTRLQIDMCKVDWNMYMENRSYRIKFKIVRNEQRKERELSLNEWLKNRWSLSLIFLLYRGVGAIFGSTKILTLFHTSFSWGSIW